MSNNIFCDKKHYNSELLFGRMVCNLSAAQLRLTGTLLMNWQSSVKRWKPWIWSVPSTTTQHQNQQKKCTTMLRVHNKLMI